MPQRKNNGTQRFLNEDLVLDVGTSFDRRKWDEGKYDLFIDALCGAREYQKDAIHIALRYLLGGEYRDLRDLAIKNFKGNEVLREKYGSEVGFERHLQLPAQLSATLDLATGTGKSFVMYGIAAIMLAEGVVDRVLVLCPSTTIEDGLTDKFKKLARNADLQNLLPQSAIVNTPKIINANESIVAGSICIENYHAILAHVRSSIRDSLTGNGQRTLVLNDEVHHVANETTGHVKRWKEFLTDSDFGFRYIIGVSGTCYIGNDYFADVIFRYSLRKAMEERFIKKVRYVADISRSNVSEEDKWQLVLNNHEEIRKKLKLHQLRPLTIVITKDIKGCEDVAARFASFLAEHSKKSAEQIKEEILVVHSNASDLARLPAVDNARNKVEWIFSVSMLNEGWDVKRVFQIVPHEKRAFESKLLIAQVLGRGLRVPEDWKGEQPEVTVFNHDKWAEDIKHLVDEVMEIEKRIPTFPLKKSEFNFDLLNIEYDPKPYFEKSFPMSGKYKLFEKGFVDLSREQSVEEVRVEFEEASTGERVEWKTKILHKTYTPDEIAKVMYQRFEDLPDVADQKYYEKQFPIDRLEQIIKKSLEKSQNKTITDGIRQKFLQSLGTLQRRGSQIVRYDFEAKRYIPILTTDRPLETVSASELRNTKTLFFTAKTKGSISPDEYDEAFYDEATENGSGYKCALVSNAYDFKTPLNAVIADHENERKFIKELTAKENVSYIDAWMKSTPMGFYEIDYFWRKGEHPKRGRFNPDFFIKTGNFILVVEIKDDSEIAEPSEENKKKSEYAIKHFERANAYLKKNKSKIAYQFNFLTPSDFGRYFQSIRDDEILGFRSNLDVALAE